VNKQLYYHTQECRKDVLRAPVKCTRDDAWLGEAYYFWFDLEDADEWGINSKRAHHYYEVYKSEIDIDNVLNTVFNEEHYYFWYRQIDKVAKAIIAKTKMKPSIKELNDYFKERGFWSDLDGILFQDLPTNPNKLLIKPIEYSNKTKKVVFPYRKRIQLAVYNSKIIVNFALLKREKCI
jgi:hypothetical protein